MHKNQRTALFSIQMLISGAFYHKAFFAANYTCLQNLIESRGCIMDTFLPHAIFFFLEQGVFLPTPQAVNKYRSSFQKHGGEILVQDFLNHLT